MILHILIGMLIGGGAVYCAIIATKPDFSHFSGLEFEIKKPESKKIFKNGRRNVSRVIKINDEEINASAEVVLRGYKYPKT